VASGAAYAEALRILARRELPAAGVRTRLLDRGFLPDEIDSTIARLTENGAIDDRRVARAYARTAVSVKGRGRTRVGRELLQMGIDPEVVAEALGEVFGEQDERTLVNKAIQKKLRGRAKPSGPAEHARLYQYLMRQGFSHTASLAALRRFRTGGGADQE